MAEILIGFPFLISSQVEYIGSRIFVANSPSAVSACGFAMIADSLGPRYDLLAYLRGEAERHQDIYRPDDTHFSADGHRLLAARVAALMR